MEVSTGRGVLVLTIAVLLGGGTGWEFAGMAAEPVGPCVLFLRCYADCRTEAALLESLSVEERAAMNLGAMHVRCDRACGDGPRYGPSFDAWDSRDYRHWQALGTCLGW